MELDNNPIMELNNISIYVMQMLLTLDNIIITVKYQTQ